MQSITSAVIWARSLNSLDAGTELASALLRELKGEKGLNGEKENGLSGTAGVRVNFSGVGPFQPKLGIGYVFPISSVARDDFKWGVVTSLVFEY